MVFHINHVQLCDGGSVGTEEKYQLTQGHIVAEISVTDEDFSLSKVSFSRADDADKHPTGSHQEWSERDLLELGRAAREAYNWICDKAGWTRIT